jgi:hypothetical protein
MIATPANQEHEQNFKVSAQLQGKGISGPGWAAASADVRGIPSSLG